MKKAEEGKEALMLQHRQTLDMNQEKFNGLLQRLQIKDREIQKLNDELQTMDIYKEQVSTLKALIQPACFAGVISWLAFVVAIFMAHENGDNKASQEATGARHSGGIRAFGGGNFLAFAFSAKIFIFVITSRKY